MHTIIAAAAVKFDSSQLESLFLLIQKVKLEFDSNQLESLFLRIQKVKLKFDSSQLEFISPYTKGKTHFNLIFPIN